MENVGGVVDSGEDLLLCSLFFSYFFLIFFLQFSLCILILAFSSFSSFLLSIPLLPDLFL